MSWHLKKNSGDVFGPVELDILVLWAKEGRIAPDDEVSQDLRSWSPANKIDLLEMVWTIDLEDGGTFGPINLLAFREPIIEGDIPPYAYICHIETGERKTLHEFLFPACISHSIELQGLYDSLLEKYQDLETTFAESSTVGSTAQPNVQNDFKETANRRDFFEREATKWKSLYEEVSQQSLDQETELQDQVRALRKSESEARNQLDRISIKLKQVEKNYTMLQEATQDAAGLANPDAADLAQQHNALLQAYNEMSKNFDRLLEELSHKNAEVESLVESRNQIEKMAEQRVRHMEKLLKTEHEETNDMRKHMAEVEEAHHELLKAYREMNDRYFNLRQSVKNINPPPKTVQTGPSQPSKAQPSAASDKPRIRLD